MPMGIVSDNEFESELNNVSSKAIRSELPPCVNSNNFVPTIIDMVPLDDDTSVLPTHSNIDLPINAEVQQIKSRGRSEGDLNVPEPLRKLIGETAAIEGRSAALALAKGLGISESSASAYAVGATSTATYNEPQDELRTYIDTRKKKLSKKALNRLNLAIHYVTRQKLQDAKLSDIVSVANAMSQVVKNLAPPESKSPVEIQNKPVFVMMAPVMKSEDKYEVIHSRE